MPHIRFNDTNLRSLRASKTTWFTDPDVKSLRLCVTAGGTKTWWVSKWDATSQKTRSVKLGQWATQGTHCKWAKEQVGLTAHAITTGTVRTKQEKVVEAAGVEHSTVLTFASALDQFIAHRRAARASGKASMTATTERDYRGSFRVHLSEWADTPVDALPILAINQYLNELQLTRPQGAARAATIAGVVVRFVNKLCAFALPIPGLLDPTKPRSRVETGKLDMAIPLRERWDEICQIENEHIRLAWQILVYTGMRWRPLREMTWDQVNLAAGCLTLTRPVKKKAGDRTVFLSDDALRMFKRLREIRYDDCEWVFPSRRHVGDVRGHLDSLDRLPLTSQGDIRHYWMTTAREVAARHVMRWLALHTMTDDDLRMLGHYGEPTPDEQKRAANAIAKFVSNQVGLSPANVVAMTRETA